MGILEKITATKKKEVEADKRLKPVSELKRSPFFSREVCSFRNALDKQYPAIIAEFKRRSPSKGIINNYMAVETVTAGYQIAGASAVSVLTDREYFGGSAEDMVKAAAILEIPVLRKDFIIDDYQVIEAKSAGASAILLIGSILSRKESKSMTRLALDLGMDVLFEIHDACDLDVMDPSISIIGVNNRNLQTFDISMVKSSELLKILPSGSIKVAESGFESPADVKKMFSCGYNAFLIGTRFMKTKDPGRAAADFINEL